MNKRVINVNILPGEPTNGGGRACIHLFVQDERGVFTEPNAMHIEQDSKRLVARPTRGRLACDPRRTVTPVTRGNVTTVTIRTDDPRAVTCPKCIASPGYAGLMELITAAGAGK